jgi:gamma-glutamylcyclotransferase (GGCT)/AIG2-like uncharacterized protein YtfP
MGKSPAPSGGKTFNLFVYGTLMVPTVFRSVLGYRLVTDPAEAVEADCFVARDAVLAGYKKTSPDGVYLYAVPDPLGRIRGYVIGPLPAESLEALHRYEGRNYRRVRVTVSTAQQQVSAVAFVAQLPELRHSFGWAFRDKLKQEVLLRGKIAKTLLDVAQPTNVASRCTSGPSAVQTQTSTVPTESASPTRAKNPDYIGTLPVAPNPEALPPSAQPGAAVPHGGSSLGIVDEPVPAAQNLSTLYTPEQRAVAELRGPAIRDIIRRHFAAGGISDFAIRSALTTEPLREFGEARADPEAARLAPHYLSLLARQVLFNQIEERIRDEFRLELDRMEVSEKFYERTISALAALRLLNERRVLLDLLVGDMLADLPFGSARLMEYVRWAVSAADVLFHRPAAQRELEYIRDHSGGGAIPLGAELEFSNIGHAVITDPAAKDICDRQYDGFLYFRDFALDILAWKLGGHVDDHRVKTSTRRRRGFFELAFGSLSVEANISKPITDDPWLLNQMIHAALEFYDIAPHSLHISLQLRSQHKPGQGRLLPLYAMKCLLAIAGDPGPDAAGQVRIRRITAEEIGRVEPSPNLLFCDISRRHSADMGEGLATLAPSATGRYVQQYKFLRLSPQINYEPLAVALKGLQMSLRPGSFMTPQQYKASRQHRERFHAIMDWAANPTPISQPEVYAFLGHIYDGLASEHQGKSAYGDAYISWTMDRLREAIAAFNATVAPQGVHG